jgi:DNA-binding GntR family transcriptional regulator
MSDQKSNAAHKVYDSLRAMVLNGELAPGTQILEQELAEMVGMSRTPVREALIRLQSDGLVEVVPRHGVRIVPMSLTDMHDIYMILVGLEPVAASLAAERGVSEEELAVLIRATEAMESALDRDDMEGWALADEEFHLAVMHQSGNSRLTAIVTNTWDQVHRARQLTIRLRHPNQPPFGAGAFPADRGHSQPRRGRGRGDFPRPSPARRQGAARSAQDAGPEICVAELRDPG